MKNLFLLLLLAGLAGAAHAQTAPVAKEPVVKETKPLTAAAAHRAVVANSQAIGRKFRQPSKPGTRPNLRLPQPAEVQ